MKRSIISVLAVSAALALSGCSAGLYSQTAEQVAAVPGYSVTYKVGPDLGTVQIRNAHLPYPGVDGYNAGADAPIKIWLFNNTEKEVRVVLTSEAGTVSPSTPIVIPPAGKANPELKLTGLKQAVAPGAGVKVEVELVGIDVITVPLPVAPPPSPTERTPEPAKGIIEQEGH